MSMHRKKHDIQVVVHRSEAKAAAPLASLVKAAPALLEACTRVVKVAKACGPTLDPELHAAALMCADAVRLATKGG